MRRMILDALGMPAAGPLLAQRWRRNGTSHRVRNSSGERTKVDDCCCDGGGTTYECSCCADVTAAENATVTIAGVTGGVAGSQCTASETCTAFNSVFALSHGAGFDGCHWFLPTSIQFCTSYDIFGYGTYCIRCLLLSVTCQTISGTTYYAVQVKVFTSGDFSESGYPECPAPDIGPCASGSPHASWAKIETSPINCINGTYVLPLSVGGTSYCDFSVSTATVEFGTP